MTRVTRSAQIVPFILEELAEARIPNSRIRFIAALGSHGTLNRVDFVRKLGEEVARVAVGESDAAEMLAALIAEREQLGSLLRDELITLRLALAEAGATSQALREELMAREMAPASGPEPARVDGVPPGPTNADGYRRSRKGVVGYPPESNRDKGRWHPQPARRPRCASGNRVDG